MATVFQIFDPTLSGIIDVPTFEVMVRSLGFRMTGVEIAGKVEMIWEERQQQKGGQAAGNDDATAEERRRIDLPMAIQILSQTGYARRNTEDEMQLYFRIFDHGNKGCVTLEDLKRVQNEVRETENDMNLGLDSNSSGNDGCVVGDATLQAMIDQFDQNRDGVIDYEEFKTIMEPMLSCSASS